MPTPTPLVSTHPPKIAIPLLRGISYADAPFPRKHTRQTRGRRLDERRVGLECWIRKVVHDPMSQGAQRQPDHHNHPQGHRPKGPKGRALWAPWTHWVWGPMGPQVHMGPPGVSKGFQGWLWWLGWLLGALWANLLRKFFNPRETEDCFESAMSTTSVMSPPGSPAGSPANSHANLPTIEDIATPPLTDDEDNGVPEQTDFENEQEVTRIHALSPATYTCIAWKGITERLGTQQIVTKQSPAQVIQWIQEHDGWHSHAVVRECGASAQWFYGWLPVTGWHKDALERDVRERFPDIIGAFRDVRTDQTQTVLEILKQGAETDVEAQCNGDLESSF